MGWTGTHKPHGQSIKSFFTDEFRSEDGFVHVIDCAVVQRTTAYIAYKLRSGSVICVVCLLRYNPHDYFNFYYKDVSEDMGPYQCDIPERIFKLLTPDAPELNDWAREWRKKCQERLESVKKMRGIRKAGNVLKLEYPVTLRGGRSIDTVKVIRPNSLVFWNEDVGMVRLRKRHIMNANVIATSNPPNVLAL